MPSPDLYDNVGQGITKGLRAVGEAPGNAVKKTRNGIGNSLEWIGTHVNEAGREVKTHE